MPSGCSTTVRRSKLSRQHSAAGSSAGVSSWLGGWDQRLEDLPFLIAETRLDTLFAASFHLLALSLLEFLFLLSLLLDAITWRHSLPFLSPSLFTGAVFSTAFRGLCTQPLSNRSGVMTMHTRPQRGARWAANRCLRGHGRNSEDATHHVDVCHLSSLW